MAIYIVVPKGSEAPVKKRLIKAERINQVEQHLLSEFEITKADAEEAAELAGSGVKVETVKAE